MDHNAWFPDGAFNMNVGGSQINYTSLANARSNIPAVANVFGASQRFVGDVITASNPFANAITLGADCMTEYTSTPDATLSASGPKNLGVDIPGITNGFSGAAPDMGAVITGRPVVTYGDVPTWLTGLAALAWTSLANTNLARVGADTGVFAYSGAALRESDSKLIFFGGGHFDSSTNVVYGVTLSDNAPTSVVLNAGSSPNTATDVEYQADGKPSARHTWGDLQVDNATNRMVTMECINPYGNSGIYRNARDGFDLSTNTWLPAGTYGNAPFADGYATIANSSAKDALGNIIWWEEAGSNLYKMTPGSTATMSLVSSSMPPSTYNGCLAYDSTRNRFITFCNGNSPVRIDGTTYAVTSIAFSGSSSAANTGSYWAYCPERDSFLGITYTGGSVVVYECNASTFAISVLSVSGSAPVAAADGVNNCYGRWGYAPRLRGIYFAPQVSSNVYFFRTVTFPGACTPGSTIVVLFSKETGTGTAVVSDPTNGTYNADSYSQTVADARGAGVYSKPNTASTALTITLTLGASDTGVLKAYEVAGPPASSYLNAHIEASGGGISSLISAAVANGAVANCSIFAAFAGYAGPTTLDTGFTEAYPLTGGTLAYHKGEYDLDVSSGTTTLSFGSTVEQNPWVVAAASYKPSSTQTQAPRSMHQFRQRS
jgi:hypothetical protein